MEWADNMKDFLENMFYFISHLKIKYAKKNYHHLFSEESSFPTSWSLSIQSYWLPSAALKASIPMTLQLTNAMNSFQPLSWRLFTFGIGEHFLFDTLAFLILIKWLNSLVTSQLLIEYLAHVRHHSSNCVYNNE